MPAEAVWQVGGDVTPSPREVEMMALVLEGRHGRYAADVAEFFSSFHASEGDAGRSWAWAGVAETVRRRALAGVVSRRVRRPARARS